MALFGSFGTVRAQAPAQRGFAIAFSYVEELLRADSPARARLQAMAVGTAERIDLAEGVYAMEQAYLTKARIDGFFEAHRKYIDVQVVVEGEEAIEVVDAARGTVKQPYVAERDLVIYEGTAEASALKLGAGAVAIFFPADVHMPSLRAGAAAVTVRKTVVKVPVISV